ncbi:SDR family oxidoreductase [Deinococcus detaillensis]|uniref:SDR family oxidoreductase n=1 Tax=Deinococcus detaillensis TaxID=2592048 RepID=A0A553V1P6_9DEIO|nr:SDR family oxidoreductase [Deinococcus detaillensis]TSA86151.1 SDR family oxidoreductase [Deinococcus detaillensis]
MIATTLITGASGDIGSALAQACRDHRLILQGRDEAKLSALCAELPNARPLLLDLARPETFAAALADLPPLTNLIHNAGTVELGPVAEQDHSVWTNTLAVNVVAPAELTRLLLPNLRQMRGCVVFINSGAGLSASAGWSSYAASKFALRALADALRAEESGAGLRVTSIYPGRTASAMQQKVRRQEGETYDAETFIQPQTLAQTVRFVLDAPRDILLSDVTARSTGGA